MLSLRVLRDEVTKYDLEAAMTAAVEEGRREAKKQFEWAAASALRDLAEEAPIRAASSGLSDSPFGQELMKMLPSALRSIRTEVMDRDGMFELVLAPPDEDRTDQLTAERALLALEVGTSRSRPVSILQMLQKRFERSAESIENAIVSRMTSSLRRSLR